MDLQRPIRVGSGYIGRCQNNAFYPDDCPNTATKVLRQRGMAAADGWRPQVCNPCAVTLTSPDCERPWEIVQDLFEASKTVEGGRHE